MPASFPFRMYFSMAFEKAVAEMDFWRPREQRLMIYPQEGKAYSPTLTETNAYREEIRYFCQQLLEKKPFTRVPLIESFNALKLCLLAAQAARQNGTITI